MNSKTKTIVGIDDAAAEAAALLKALANQDRLLILCHLADGEKNVTDCRSCLGFDSRQFPSSYRACVTKNWWIAAEAARRFTIDCPATRPES